MTRCRACTCVSMFANVVQHLKCDQQRRGADIVTRRVTLEDFPTFKFKLFLALPARGEKSVEKERDTYDAG